jgi:HEAT repeat protein
MMNDYIRKIAADSLIQIVHEQAIPHLINILTHYHWPVRQTR